MKRLLRDAGAFGVFVLLTLAMTWPWAAHLRDTSFDPGDSYLSAWTLAWDFHQTFRDPGHLFDANIFFPYHDTLAFSEHDWGIALPFFPAFAAGLAPLTVQGLAMLLAFALSGFGAFRLSRTLTGSSLAGWVAGVAFAFVPYRFHHLPHLPYVHAGWMALAAEAVVLFARRPTWPRAAWLGAALVMSGLSSIHWLLLGLVPTSAMAAVLLWRAGPGGRGAWGRAAIAALVAGLLLAPFFLPYRRVTEAYGLKREASEVLTYSARPIHWITPDWNVKVWHGSGLGENPPQGEFCLFPGLLLLVLAVLGAQRAFESGGEAARTGLLWAVLGVVGSFGMRTPLHAALYYALPPFRAIRVPARWAMLADLGLALLAGVGALVVADFLARGRTARRAFVGACLCGLLLFEDRVAPLGLHRGEADPDALSRFLRDTPMAGGIFQLPDEFGETNARYVLRAADHWKPLVNAYSGFQPPLPKRMHELLLAPEPAALLDLLEKIRVSYVTLRRPLLPPDQAEPVRTLLAEGLASGRLRFIRRFAPGDDVFAVVRTEPAARALEFLPPDRSGARHEEAALTGAVDAPAQDEIVHGALTVSGWARIPGEDLSIEILIDGIERPWLEAGRLPRRDVQAAVRGIGDCARAGYFVRFAFDPSDAGPHELVAIFHSRDGRERHYPPRRFLWTP